MFLVIIFTFNQGYSQDDVPWYIKAHYLSEDEVLRSGEVGRDFFWTPPPPAPVRNVAEFERMQSVLIRYPFGIPVSVIVEMAEDCMVTTLVANGSQENTVRNIYTQNGVNLANCEFLHAQTNSYWTRDYGPWFVINGLGEFGITNFPYNRPRPNDNDVPIVVAEYLDIELYGMDLIHTGGNYMTDGMGISASTTLVMEENEDLTVEDIDSLVYDYLGVETYHLIEDPLHEPPQNPIEHIDCWGKFLDIDKVLIGQVPETDYRYEDFEEIATYFSGQNCSYGYPYQVYRVQTPGNYPNTPYTNSLILNEKVFVPLTGHNLDDEAITAYENAMPGYEIVGVEYNGWYNSDALHCRAKGVADLGMLYIKHLPLYGQIPFEEEGYTISAIVRPYSGEALYPDSIRVYYQVNGGVYASEIMTQVFGYRYEATIPSKPIGSEISYYIFAADESGRSETHPFIGKADPHVFTITDPLLPDVTVDPDTLLFLTVQQCLDGQDVIVSNQNADTSVNINYINNEDNDVFNWYIDPWSITFPYLLEPGDSLTLTVKIALPAATVGNILYDTLFIETDASTHQTFIGFDEDLVGMNEIHETIESRIYPNPFSNDVTIAFEIHERQEVSIAVFDLTGKMVKKLSKGYYSSGKHTVEWDGKNSINSEVVKGFYMIRIETSGDHYFSKILKM